MWCPVFKFSAEYKVIESELVELIASKRRLEKQIAEIKMIGRKSAKERKGIYSPHNSTHRGCYTIGLNLFLYRVYVQKNILFNISSRDVDFSISKIYRYKDNPHIYHRARCVSGIAGRTRISTKIDALKSYISFDSPEFTFGEAGYTYVKSVFYCVPKSAFSSFRHTGQNSVMGESANDHMNKKYVGIHVGYEWCHLQAHSHGGEQSISNLVAGTRNANSLQIAVEDALLSLGGVFNLTVNIICSVIRETHIGVNCRYSIFSGNGLLLVVNVNMQTPNDIGLQVGHEKAFASEVRRRVIEMCS
ncbi:hypothetical protein ACR6JC_17910 [Citrobacter europaeus]|uniref:hypothetical protein n=1 Tax=Citrobacter europaeus TaxID=1914243 RepID=UPI003EDA8EF5